MPPAESAIQPLPQNPSLNLLSNIAKQLRKAHKSRDSSVYQRIRDHHPQYAGASDEQIAGAGISLRDAQLVVAREYGFENWTHLKRHVQSLQNGDAAVALQKLVEAANNGRVTEITEILDSHPEIIDERGGNGVRTALHFATFQGHPEAVSLLLKRGANPNIRCEGDAGTPLHFAVELGDLRTVELLVSHGADVHGFGDVHGVDIIGWACVFHEKVHQHIVDYLLARGAKHNIFSAVSCGCVEAIRTLAEEDPAVLDKQMAIWEDYRRPLHQALIRRQHESVTTLVELGADLAATDTNDLTALDQATIQGESEVARFLIDHGSSIGLPAAMAMNRRQDIDRLMDADPECLEPGGKWGQLIASAAKRGSAGLLTRLLDHGADVNVMADFEGDSDVLTALHVAAYRHAPDLDVIRLLVERGADLTLKDTKFDSPPSGWAHHAGNTEAYELLREYEASQNK